MNDGLDSETTVAFHQGGRAIQLTQMHKSADAVEGRTVADAHLWLTMQDDDGETLSLCVYFDGRVELRYLAGDELLDFDPRRGVANGEV